MEFSDDFLVESKSAREQGLAKLKAQRSEEEILNKVKALFFAVWQGVGRISRQQLADFYEVPINTIDTNHQRHKDEFDADGVEVLSGKDLREVRLIMSLTSSTPKETVYTPAGALRMGFILRDSEVAKAVRTAAIRFIQGVGQQESPFNDYTLTRISLHHSDTSLPLPDGYFSCFDKMIEILQRLDVRLGYQLEEQWFDRRGGVERYLEPDISLGRHFSQLFISNHLDAEATFENERQARASNPRVNKLWNQRLIELRWKADRAAAESQLRLRHLGLPYPVTEDFIDRRRYVFRPAPNGNRPDALDAYCYSNNYTSLFYDWLRQVFFRFCWKSYITERDLDGWMMRYERFQSLPETARLAILTTSEGGMISGFEFPDTWRRQLLPGDM
jgi:hypothetical protein